MTHDLVIRGGTVVDGSGGAGVRADVGVVGSTIAEVGRIDERGRLEIDAEGHVVSPGFVDGHTHMDAQVFWDSMGTCSSLHGVTTVVMGNCGFSVAPAPASQRALVLRNLERAEDISGRAMAEGIDWSWDSFASYLDVIDRLPKAINYAGYVGHSALRTYAMGERAFDGAADADDLDAMERELRHAMRAGAIGFSTSRSEAHLTSDDRPVASRQAEWSEVVRLVSALGEGGAGIFELALDSSFYSPDPDVRARAHAQLVQLAVQTGVPTTFGLVEFPDVGVWRDQLAALDAAHDAGGRVFGQSHCRGVAVLLSFLTTLPFDRLPEWAELRERPLAEQAAQLRRGDVRQRLVAAAERGSFGEAVGAEARKPDYSALHVLEKAHGRNPTVQELADATGGHPVEVIIDAALEHDLHLFFQQFVVTEPDPTNVEVILRHPQTVMTFSDSGAHVSQIMDSSIQTELLATWVRERQVFTLEEAVHMITSVPAALWGMADRGLVREGLVADLNVFDPDTIAPELPEVVNDLPGGSRRLYQRARGFKATVVGGVPIMVDGEPTGARPGQLVRGPLGERGGG